MKREYKATSVSRQTSPPVSIPTFPPPSPCMFATGRVDVRIGGGGHAAVPERCSARCAAFTRTELLAVVCVSAVILSSLLAGHSSSQSRSDTIVCMRNVRSLIEGWASYVDDHQGMLPRSSGSLAGGEPPLWAGGGWMDLPVSNRDNVDPHGGDQSISEGAIWAYVGGDPLIWRCPSDPSTGRVPNYAGGRTVPRARSYSMNSWMGRSWQDGYVVFRKLSDFALASPGEIFLIADERYDSINDGGFAVDMSGYNPADITGGAGNRSSRIVSFPGNYHRSAGVVGYVDGHVETHVWEDLRTTPPDRIGQELRLNILSPGNRDVGWLQSRATVPVQ